MASSSHIRAILREDNLGIGAAGPGANNANECTGLDVFKDLLGRLNGTSEAVIDKQRQARENVKLTLYVERRFGPMRFVRGGFLIGDDMEDEKGDEAEADADALTTAQVSTSESASSASEPEVDDSKAARKKAKKEKKERKEKKDKSKKRKATSDDEEDGATEVADSQQKEKKSKRRKKDDVSEVEAVKDESQSTSSVEDEKTDKAEKNRSKKDKKEKKDKREKKVKGDKSDKKDKKDKKEKKRRRDAESGASTPAATETGEEMDTDTATPSESEKPTSAYPTSLMSSRHLARRRYINQKRAAVADPQALKQVRLLSLIFVFCLVSMNR